MDVNFLTKILTSEDYYIPSINSKILEVVSHTNTLKHEVKAVIEASYSHFTPILKENEQLKTKSEYLLKEMEAVQAHIAEEINNELSDCKKELGNLSRSLKEVKLYLNVLTKLVDVNALVKEARLRVENKEYVESARIIKGLQDRIRSNTENLTQVDVFRTLCQDVVLTYELLMHQIGENWRKCVQYKSEEDLIKIQVDMTYWCDFEKTLLAAHILEANGMEMRFSSFLMNEVLKKVILNKVEITHKDTVLEVRVLTDKPSHLEVFENVKKIVDFLSVYFNIKLEDDVYLLSEIGNDIADDFADFLIKNCLAATIPSTSDALDEYKAVLKEAEDFEKSLQEKGFLSRSASSLLDYAKNINIIFANKFCQSFLQKAREIMKKDLHNVTECEEICSNISCLPTKEKNLLKNKMNVRDDILVFNKCQISTPAAEMMELIESMIKEITKSLDLCAVRLFFTVRNIFEMYAAVVPLHHKKFLETLPHQVALFHNNCMFFTHKLINLTSEYYTKIPNILKDHFRVLLEEAVVLRTLATETLEVTVTNQRNQLIYILRDSGYAALEENPVYDPDSEKSLRQCIRQIQILQTVWKDVLPMPVYNRAIGYLFDAVFEELINLVIVVEDIPSATATELVSNFKMLLEKAPTLFTGPDEVYRYCRKWPKFNEFLFILKGTLRDIDDRWANGMGPLAVEFTSAQVKHLIRALFQNSERRATVLTRIR